MNFMHWGSNDDACKRWMFIPNYAYPRFCSFCRKVFSDHGGTCACYGHRHKIMLMDPEDLESYDVDKVFIDQFPGDLMLIFSGTFHEVGTRFCVFFSAV